MPKKNNKTELTIEEKLNQALIPIAEQPYEIPENWCWTYLNDVAEIITGGTPSKKHLEYYGGNFPFFKPADLDNGRHVFVASEYLSNEGKKVSRIIPANSTAVCCIGSIGKTGFLEVEGTTNQQINSAIPKFNPLFLFYFLNTDIFKNQLLEKSCATTISIVNKSKMETCFFPLPPLAEQQRIVDLIERLFAKLDEAKEKVQTAIDSFELRKAAILHKAFTGELTRRWREEKEQNAESKRAGEQESKRAEERRAESGELEKTLKKGSKEKISLSAKADIPLYERGSLENSADQPNANNAEGLPLGWEQRKLSDVVDDFKYGTCEKSNYSNIGLPVLRIPNIGDNGEINLDDLKYLSSDNIGEAHLVKNNDILIIRSNGSRDLVGKCALIENLTNNYAYASFLIRVRPTNDIYPKFLSKYLSSKDAQNQMFNFAKSSAGIHNINSQELGAINLKLPPLPEQKEIVRILDTLLAKSDRAKELAENALENIETLKKTILSKAFRGLLGTNRADEESSLELLRQVL